MCFSDCCCFPVADLLTSHEIDLDTFATLSECDLREIGVKALGARRKMLVAISGNMFLSFENPFRLELK